MKLSRQASNCSTGGFICNLQMCTLYGMETHPRSARIDAGKGCSEPCEGAVLAGREACGSLQGSASAQSTHRAYFCFTLLTPTASLTTYYQSTGESQGEHQSTGKQELATWLCTKRLVLHHVLMAWGTGRNLPWPKGIPKAFSCVFVECLIPKHKHKNTECLPIFFYPTWNA